ncbi:MAG: efflux RND transporter periplasmic adaptor subunit [Gammaproteobacteria bacterium]
MTRQPRLFAMLALCALAWTQAGCNNNENGELSLSGTVEARETVLAFQVSGRIGKLLVDEGEAVSQGQEVATLVTADYEQAVIRARAEVAAAEAALAALVAGSREQEIGVARATLEQARAEERFARDELQRIRSLIAKKLTSEENLDQARLRLDVASAAVNRAKQQLLLLQEGPRKEDIDRARAELEARKSALQTAEQQLSYTRLVSPADGLITLRQSEAGEVVSAGKPVFRLAELKRPWVRAYINEVDLTRVRLGQSATVTVDGLPDRSFDGTLTFISPKAEFTPKSVETRALRVDLVYRVRVQLQDPDGLLKLGMPADVVFEEP